MAKLYGDIPCVKLAGKIHITTSGTHCVCGTTYHYSRPGRDGKCVNTIWRKLDAVSCPRCKELYMETLLFGDTVIVSPKDTDETCGYTGTVFVDELHNQ